MEKSKLDGSSRPIDRRAGLSARLSASETPPISEVPPSEANVELLRGRTQLGNVGRRVTGSTDPDESIEIHREEGCGARAGAEGEALSKSHYWEVERRSEGWLRKLLGLLHLKS
jgi:hypothetical protein